MIIRKKRFYIISIIILSIIQLSGADLSTILRGVFRQQDKMDSEIQDATFDGSFSYVEMNKNRDTIKTMYSKRHIYTKGYNKQKSEYWEIIKDGKKLSGEEMKKEMKQSRGDMNTKLPFASPYRNNYSFSYLGEEYYNNMAVWKIGYKPNKKGKDMLQGFAYILKNDSNVVQYQFTPVGLPFVLKNFNIVLDYSKTDKYWVPTKFYLQMEIDVKVIFSLAHKFIVMQEYYTNYKFNNGLSDEMFK